MRRLTWLLTLVMLMSVSLSALGQAGGPAPDRDGDGLPDSVDSCPSEAGPRENNGCPLPAPQEPAPSTEEPAPQPSTPEEAPAPTPEPVSPSADAPTLNPLRPSAAGDCQLGTLTTALVNVRSGPSLNASVVGTLNPNQLYNVSGTAFAEGGVWYLVVEAGGWVSGAVVNVNGQCSASIRSVRTEADAIERLPNGTPPNENCTALPNGKFFCLSEAARTSAQWPYSLMIPPADGSRAGLVSETRCTVLPGGGVFCYDILTAYAPDSDATSGGIVTQKKCVNLPDGTPFCYDILLAILRPDGDSSGLVPQTKCTTILNDVPVCYNVLVGIAPNEPLPQTREHILLARQRSAVSHQCTLLADGSEFCYNTLSLILPDSPSDDGTTADLMPQTVCVETLNDTPFCFTTLVAVAEDADGTAGLVPGRECVDVLGESVCFSTLTALAPDADGSSSGLVPTTQCTDFMGQVVCFDTLTAIAPDADGSSSGLVPTTQCTDFMGQVVCFDTLTAYLPDDSIAGGLVPGMKCVPMPDGTPFCYPTLIAVPNEPDAASVLFAVQMFRDSANPDPRAAVVEFAVQKLRDNANDGASSGIAPQTVCTDFMGQIVCYTILSARLPDDADLDGEIVFGVMHAAPRPGGGLSPLAILEIAAPILRDSNGDWQSGLDLTLLPPTPDLPFPSNMTIKANGIINDVEFLTPIPTPTVGSGTCSYFPTDAASPLFPKLNGHVNVYKILEGNNITTQYQYGAPMPLVHTFTISNVLMAAGETFTYQGVISNIFSSSSTIAGVMRDTTTQANVVFVPAAALSNQISFTAPADGIYDIQIGRNLILKTLANWDFINIGDEVYADAITCNLP